MNGWTLLLWYLALELICVFVFVGIGYRIL